jgi:hypothetical protein
MDHTMLFSPLIYCNSNIGLFPFASYKVIALPTIATARKSDNYRYRDSWKSDNFRERAIKKEAKN